MPPDRAANARAPRGQHHPGSEAPQKPIQLGQGMQKRPVREQTVDGLVDLTQPEGKKQPGKDAGPGEHGAERKEQTVGFSSQHGGKPAAPPRFTQLRPGPRAQLGKTRWKNSARPATPSLA